MNSSVLMLNNTYEVLGEVSLQRAVRLLYAKRAEVIHDNGLLRSGVNRQTKTVLKIPLPSIIRLLYYAVRRKSPAVTLSKKNVLLRDDYICGYCSCNIAHGEASVDHVHPQSRGGKSTWQNLVACCRRCNQRKGNRTPEEAGMALKRKPGKPTYLPFVTIKKHTIPNEWINYLNLYSVGIEELPVQS